MRPRISRTLLAVLLFAGLTLPSVASAMVILSEVFVNPLTNGKGDDKQLEWIELYNPTGADIVLDSYTIGYGGPDYTFGSFALSGTIGAGQTFVIGGPLSNASNYNPIYDQVIEFSPGLENTHNVADGIALFDTSISTTIPIDVVIYGRPGATNSNLLIDETGAVGAIDVFQFASDVSFEFTGAIWAVQATPTPNSWSAATPEPSPGVLLLVGLVILAAQRRRALALRSA